MTKRKVDGMKKKFSVVLIVSLLSVLISGYVFADTIKVLPKKDPDSAMWYKGEVTQYNPDNQKWVTFNGTAMYKYKGKLSSRYYKIWEDFGAFVPNKKQKITVTLQRTYTYSVTRIVEDTIGVTTTNKLSKLAVKMDKRFSTSTTVSASYSGSLQVPFNLKYYNKNYTYMPALFGTYLKYGTLKTNRATGKTSTGKPIYVLIDEAPTLRLAYRNY